MAAVTPEVTNYLVKPSEGIHELGSRDLHKSIRTATREAIWCQAPSPVSRYEIEHSLRGDRSFTVSNYRLT